MTPIKLVSAALLCSPVLMGADGSGCTPEPKVQIVADSYCQAAKKRTWSVNDTPETIAEAIRINGGIDRACGRKS